MKHGLNAYKHGCKCRVCRKASRDYQRAWRARQPSSGRSLVPVGAWSEIVSELHSAGLTFVTMSEVCGVDRTTLRGIAASVRPLMHPKTAANLPKLLDLLPEDANEARTGRLQPGLPLSGMHGRDVRTRNGVEATQPGRSQATSDPRIERIHELRLSMRGVQGRSKALWDAVSRRYLFPVEALPARVLNFPADFAWQYAHRHGYHTDAYWKLLEGAKRRGGFTRTGADRVAAAAGVHPGAIWPDEWFYDTDPIESESA